ncbi:unnamed protein product, partial [Mycena citricolor]
RAAFPRLLLPDHLSASHRLWGPVLPPTSANVAFLLRSRLTTMDSSACLALTRALPPPRMFLFIQSCFRGAFGSSVVISARHFSRPSPSLMVSSPMAFSLPHERAAFLAPVDAQPGKDPM